MATKYLHDASVSLITCLLVPVAASFLGYGLRRRDLDHIVTVGYSDPFLSWLSAIRYFFNAREILKEGYALYPHGSFKMATFYGWTVVLNGKHYVEDITRSNPNTLSSIQALVNMYQLNATFGEDAIEKHHHVASVIRTSVTRNLDDRFFDTHQEVVRSFNDILPVSSSQKGTLPAPCPLAYDLMFHDLSLAWVPVTAYSMAVDVICRVTTHYFFGKPLSDDPKFRAICEQATMEILKGSFVRPFPTFVKPLLASLITRAYILRREMAQYLAPMVNERIGKKEQPNDLITWLIDGGIAAQKPVTVDDISSRVLIINFTAVHTTSAVFTGLLYELCRKPQDVAILRDEVERVLEEEGWTRHAMARMCKLDSYLRETQRLNTISDISVSKVVLDDYTFSDGLKVPKGVNISVNVYARHHSADNYAQPEVFDGFRHVPEESKSQAPATGPTLTYHAFGHGKSACPGRFLAVMEIKLMLAHLLVHYEFRLQKDEYPSKLLIDANALPNRAAKVLFRKRQTV